MSRASCQYFQGCKQDATRGAYWWRSSVEPAVGRPFEASARFVFALFCTRHAEEAVSRGARHMSWRPKPASVRRVHKSVADELRQYRRGQMSPRANSVYVAAAVELRERGMARPATSDILSEAIEAAEALGL